MNTLDSLAGRLVLAGILVAGGAGPAAAAGASLTVGVKQAPPFAIENVDGSWSGMSIDLWRMVAADLGVQFELVERDLEGLLEGLEAGELDVGVAALTVTAEREARLDFTHAFYTSGLGIAVATERGSLVGDVARRVASGEFLVAFGSLMLVLFAAGAALWLFERRRNEADFGGSALEGLGNAFWWSAVTMTTVGYGDKVPRTLGGRVIGLLWMFTGVITISAFTASIATTLTLSGLEGAVKGPDDLPEVRVVTLAESTSAAYLDKRQIAHRTLATAADALDQIAAGRADAVVYDAPLLRYLVNSEYADSLRVLPTTFERQDYAFALPAGSGLRERLNRAVLERIAQSPWQDVVQRYLGR